ncbi:hypothetical protein [Shinella sp.]|uniref:hypothetical protein n=1 Tax=Shinella sp. TaxID=1870904 RepID=UPI003F6F6229
MGDVVNFQAKDKRVAEDGVVSDAMICADWALGGITEILRRMTDEQLEAIYVKAYGVFDATPDDEINPENEALITLIECETDRPDWDGDAV